MKLDRLFNTASNAAGAFTFARVCFQTPSRRRPLLALAATGASVLTLGLAACDRSDGSPRTGCADLNTVDFRVFPPEGFTGTVREQCTARFTNGLGGYSADSRSAIQVLSVREDQVTFKTTISTKSNFWGTATPNPEADHSKSRLCIQTLDRRGNVLSSEGASPDGYAGAIYPDHPVRKGESWTTELSGMGMNAGTTCTVTNTLKEVVLCSGRPMAVVTFSAQLSDADMDGTQWVDIQTGQLAKLTCSGTGLTADGLPVSIKGTTSFTDAAGKRWVD